MSYWPVVLPSPHADDLARRRLETRLLVNEYPGLAALAIGIREAVRKPTPTQVRAFEKRARRAERNVHLRAA